MSCFKCSLVVNPYDGLYEQYYFVSHSELPNDTPYLVKVNEPDTSDWYNTFFDLPYYLLQEVGAAFEADYYGELNNVGWEDVYNNSRARKQNTDTEGVFAASVVPEWNRVPDYMCEQSDDVKNNPVNFTDWANSQPSGYTYWYDAWITNNPYL